MSSINTIVPNDEIAARINDRKLIDKALRQATRTALLRHKREGVSIIVSDSNGKMTEIPPERIVIPPPED
jgi:hypothetical protein